MSKIIECQVNDEYILGSGVVIGAAGSYGGVILRLAFNESWIGLSLAATFVDALGQDKEYVGISQSMGVEGEFMTYDVPIPGVALKYPGRSKLTITGYSVYKVEENGEVSYRKDRVTNTATAFFRVLESDTVMVSDEGVDASIAEQALAWANEASQYANVASEYADAASEYADAASEYADAAEGAKDGADLFCTYAINASNAAGEFAGNAATSAGEALNAASAAAQSAAEVSDMLGDLHSSLDRIIAIQEELMGGAGV
jgi:hypothetical protein